MRKKRGLSILQYGTSNPVNSLLYDKTKMYRTFTENLPTTFRKIIFSRNYAKIIFLRFSVDFQIFRELPEKSPRISRKIIAHEFYERHFPECHNFPKFSDNFETILINVHFQFCLAAESIGPDGAMLSDDPPIKLRERRAG